MEPTNNRVCAFTYVNEKDLPEGQKLLACSRCQETFYVSLEAMAEHWPVHGQVCCALHEDDPVLELIHQGGFESFKEAMNEVVRILSNRLHGRSLLYALQQALQFLKNRPGGTEFDEEINQAYLDVVYALGELTCEAVSVMWAIPGFVGYFLGPSVWNPLEATGRRLRDGEALSAGGDQSDHGRQDVAQLNGLYCAMLVTIVLDTPIASPETLEGQEGRLQACVHRHFFQMWADRQVPTSWPETLWIKDDYDYVVTRMDQFWEELGCFAVYKWTKAFLEHSLMRPHELVPGLTVKNLLVLLMEDQTLFEFLSRKQLDDECKRLLHIFNHGTLAFSYFSTENCIELFKIAEKWNPPDRHVNPTNFEGIFQQNLTLFDFVLYIFTLDQTKRVIDLKHSSLAESSLAHVVVNHYYQGLMDETMPLLQVFLEAFNNHQRQLISQDEQPIDLPEEVVEQIAEFAFPNNIPDELLYIHGEPFPVE